jgi:murein DD-endopeptidase MepM/ murein hydrolase activator NlpD
MRLLLGFLAGLACGAGAMFYLLGPGRLNVVAPPAVIVPAPVPPAPTPTRVPVAATAMVSAPAPAIAVSTPPLAVSASAADVHVPPLAPSVSAAPAPVATVAVATPAAEGPPVPADVPGSAVSGLLFPVQGVRPGELRDTFTEARSSNRVHDAIDIMAARGTPVVAAHAGRVVKLFTSKPGGLTVYQFDPSERVIYYYAHLDHYAPGLAEGQMLRRGDPIGTVGSTGNASADAPHLHFEVQLLGPEKQWWHATSINPYGRFAGQR